MSLKRKKELHLEKFVESIKNNSDLFLHIGYELSGFGYNGRDDDFILFRFNKNEVFAIWILFETTYYRNEDDFEIKIIVLEENEIKIQDKLMYSVPKGTSLNMKVENLLLYIINNKLFK